MLDKLYQLEMTWSTWKDAGGSCVSAVLLCRRVVSTCTLQCLGDAFPGVSYEGQCRGDKTLEV